MKIIKEQTVPWPPEGCIACATNADGTWTLYEPGDEVPVFVPEPDDAELRSQYEQERAEKERAEFGAFKQRGGQPKYRAAAVKIAAEKLGLLDQIEKSLMMDAEARGDKSLYVWWVETEAISRGDREWLEVEGVVRWGKAAGPNEVFALAAQIG